jgi:hypothetical protein
MTWVGFLHREVVRELAEEVFREGQVLTQSLLLSETSLGRGGREHTKFFFVVHDFQGELRRDDLFEEERGTVENPQGSVRTERMTPPMFVNIRSLANQIFYRHTCALREYCVRLAKEAPGSRNALESIAVIDAKIGRRPR